MLDTITPVILTLNEAANISRTLEGLSWAQNVVVVDSGSVDGTRGIIESYSNTQYFQRDFDSHAQQWNFAISETGIESDWILALDADHSPSNELIEEFAALVPEKNVCGYWVRFIYCVFGRPLRASLYPPLVSLFRRGSGQYIQQGHTQRLRVNGQLKQLKAPMLHDDRKPINQWFSSQQRYMKLEAELITSARWQDLSTSNKLRILIIPAPIAALCWSLLVKGAALDGSAGWYYSFQRFIAECILSLQLLSRFINKFKNHHSLMSDNSDKTPC